jgi:hypothetical protein
VVPGTAQSLGEATGREFVDVSASWITYLDRGLYERTGALPDVRVIEHSGGGGDVFVLAPTPEQLRLIDRVRESIAQTSGACFAKNVSADRHRSAETFPCWDAPAAAVRAVGARSPEFEVHSGRLCPVAARGGS